MTHPRFYAKRFMDFMRDQVFHATGRAVVPKCVSPIDTFIDLCYVVGLPRARKARSSSWDRPLQTPSTSASGACLSRSWCGPRPLLLFVHCEQETARQHTSSQSQSEDEESKDAKEIRDVHRRSITPLGSPPKASLTVVPQHTGSLQGMPSASTLISR